jgi:DNA-binding NarL/FixJ family response regulator
MHVPRQQPEELIMIKVMLADDHPAIRQSVCARLSKESDITIVAEVGDGQQIIPTILTKPVDVLILDLRMPNFQVSRTICKIKAQYPKVRILILSGYYTKTFINCLIEAGIDGYMSKCESLDTVVTGVKAVAEGKKWLSPEIVKTICENKDEADNCSTLPLTRQEQEIIKLMANGFKNRRIAENLDLSLSTVKFHIRNIYTKAGSTSRAEVILHFLSQQSVV